MSIYCSSCGTKNEDFSSFCNSCGGKLVNPQMLKKQTTNVPQQYPRINQFQHDQNIITINKMINVSTRSYTKWFLLFIVTGGIGIIFYIIVNFLDLRNLHTQSADNQTPPTNVNLPFIALIVLLIPLTLGYLPYFFKYNILHPHIKRTQNITGLYFTNCISGAGFLLYSFVLLFSDIILLSVLIPFVVLFSLGPLNYILLVNFILISIPFIYWDYKWQEALNGHIRYHST